jgi:DNA (cytosine-5)-methyltransferase 1
MKISGKSLRIHRQSLGLSQAKLAEISLVPQHLLSAFELGKSSLAKIHIEAVARSLADKAEIEKLTKREKRYQLHQYSDVPKIASRVRRAIQTDENPKYLKMLQQLAMQHIQDKSSGPTALSLFAGCGGFSLGFSAAGFNVKGFLELEPGLRDIYRLNFPSSVELGGDITEVGETDLFQFKEVLGEIDVIIGGPPCQGFSLSGKRDIADPRNTLFKHYLRFVDTFRPKVAVLENVRLLTSMKDINGKLVKDQITSDFQAKGYKVNFFEINAKSYGVPQNRERVIFIAYRHDIKQVPTIPDPTHGQVNDLFITGNNFRTFGDACSDLDFIESGESALDTLHEAVHHPKHVIEWLWDVPEGKSAHDNIDEKLRPPSGYNTTYKRQIWTEPAATVQTTFGMISGSNNVHPIATRSLTIREAARIQSFPDEYCFCGTLGTIRKGIGNAVPPLLAYQLGNHITRILNLVKVSSL